jgi:UDP-N-acetylglucosamine 4-epimerase
VCKSALQGIDFVSHQAALGSVPRSIADPITSNEVNVGGFLNMMVAAKDNGKIRKFVYAASSSTYGDSKELPKEEGREGKALSPYAVTKAVNEMYAHVFGKVYNFNAVGLRYFNVFGPKQNPNNPYAAVIPIFCKHFLNNSQPIINGNGETSRDFTFVENAVQANIKAFELENGEPEIFNVACGDRTSLNEIITLLNELTGQTLMPIYKSERLGDVKHSLASIEKSKGILGYNPVFSFADGLAIVYEWYSSNLSKLA